MLVTAVEAAYWIRRTYRVEIHPDRIRQWAARHHFTRYGVSRRAKIDLNEVVDHARKRGLLGGS